MTTVWPITDIVDARQQALWALDEMVRQELTDALAGWGFSSAHGIELSPYDRVYRRLPEVGGHWTLYQARVSAVQHEIAMLTVAVIFDEERPVDLLVSGAVDVVAGGCSAAALREALAQCAGPLRQVTPLALDCAPDTPLSVSELLAAAPALVPSRN